MMWFPFTTVKQSRPIPLHLKRQALEKVFEKKILVVSRGPRRLRAVFSSRVASVKIREFTKKFRLF